MRLKLYIAALLLGFSVTGFAQVVRPEAYLSYASFNTPSGQSYFEAYVNVKGNTVKFKKVSDTGYQCKVNIAVLFKQKDSTIALDSYNLLSQPTRDTIARLDFIGVRRYWLPKGEYTMYIKIEDKNNALAGNVSVSTKINVGSSKDSLDISDAEMITSYTPAKQPGAFTKSGYDMSPYVYNFYPQATNTFNFYVELYNTLKAFPDSKFAVQYFLEDAQSGSMLNNFSHTTVYSADSVIPILGGFNIENLSSGKYNLIVTVLDKTGKLKASRAFGFYRSNANSVQQYAGKNSGGGAIDVQHTFVAKIRSKDTLLEDIKELYPIANIDERNFVNVVSDKEDTLLLKRFFYSFWAVRAPADPEKEWKDYKVQVDAVNKLFGTVNKKGYQTDRGRVYLQYGAPSQRDRETINPVSYPYEIWEYYKMNDGQTDKKFVFYEPSLATNDFILLHSTARGEVQNRQWQMVLYGQTVGPYSVDQNGFQDPSGEDARDEFSNPH